MKLREQALLKVEPQVFVPTSSRPADPGGRPQLSSEWLNSVAN
jgi:hypothetical protein